MSKVKTLKEQHRFLTLNLMDVFQMIDPSGKSKYVDLLVSSVKQRLKINSDEEIAYDIKELFELRDSECPQIIKDQDSLTKGILVRLMRTLDIDEYLGTLYKFHELNERNLIENNDISKYKTVCDLNNAISLAELKIYDKDLEKQVIVLNDDRDWLVIKPLTYQSSVKYGYGTKWCTAMKHDSSHFFRYIERGILIYCINTKTGNKVGFFHSVNSDYDRETSFWDAADFRVDSMESGLPYFVIDIIKNQMVNKITNADLRSKELIESERLLKTKHEVESLEIVEEVPTPINPIEEARVHLHQAISTWANRPNNDTDDVIAEI